jgi:hypothetical protein
MIDAVLRTRKVRKDFGSGAGRVRAVDLSMRDGALVDQTLLAGTAA